MLLSVSIVHHPARDITRLLDRLGEPVDVVVDEEPDNGLAWPNAKRAWSRVQGDYHLVLENDILVCNDFLEGARRAVAAKEGVACIRFYSCWNVMYEAIPFELAAEDGKHWVELTSNWGGAQAICLRRDIAEAIVDYQHPSDYPDNRILDYLLEKGHPSWNTIPSLVQHDPQQQSLHGNGYHEANMFIGEDKSALEIDWNA